MTDCLQALTGNTAIPAAAMTQGKEGQSTDKRWLSLLYPEGLPGSVEESRAPEEIVARMLEKINS